MLLESILLYLIIFAMVLMIFQIIVNFLVIIHLKKKGKIKSLTYKHQITMIKMIIINEYKDDTYFTTLLYLYRASLLLIILIVLTTLPLQYLL